MSVNVSGFNWVDKDVMLHGVRCFGSKNSEYLVSIDIIVVKHLDSKGRFSIERKSYPFSCS